MYAGTSGLTVGFPFADLKAAAKIRAKEVADSCCEPLALRFDYFFALPFLEGPIRWVHHMLVYGRHR